MKYEITLLASLLPTATVIIEANSLEEAQDIALEMADEEKIDWDKDYCDLEGIEVMTAEEYEGEEEALNTEGDEDE